MSGYIGTQPVPQATQHRETFTATASQTTFATVGYTPQFVDVYLNGIHLLDTVDYTATNSSDVVLTTGAAASDVVEIISYTPFEVADQTFTGTTTVDVLDVTGAATGTDLTLSGGLYVGGAVAANYLDDYEEGTWTPTLLFDTANVGMTYTTQSGIYTKVGNRVTVVCNVTLSAKGSSTGALYVANLPFTAANVVVGSSAAAGVVSYYSGATGVNGMPSVAIAQGDTKGILYDAPDTATGSTALTNGNVNNTTNIRAILSYQTA